MDTQVARPLERRRRRHSEEFRRQEVEACLQPGVSAVAIALANDNNPVENAIRPVCLVKKNWLFTGSQRAGQRTAAIQGLPATAQLNGIDPAAWLRSTLEKLPTCPNRNIDSLLPLRISA